MANDHLMQYLVGRVGKATDKWSLYIDVYDEFLAPYRNDPICLLEIGVQNGGSLEVWSHYFSNARVLVGCDIEESCSELKYCDSRISIIVGDVNEQETRAKLLKKCDHFDVIIDDGSHRSGDIIKSFCKYFEKVSIGGIYLVEDLHCSYWEAYEGGLFAPHSSIAFFKRLVDIVNFEHWGIEKQRDEVLSSFVKEYGVEISDDILSEIHSIHFVNSMCIVKKKKHDENMLGKRIISGEQASIVSNVHQNHGTYRRCPKQNKNVWSVRSLLPEEELEKSIETLKNNDKVIMDQQRRIDSERQKLVMIKREIEQIKKSTSWRVTKPLRYLGTLLPGLAKVGRYLTKFHRID